MQAPSVPIQCCCSTTWKWMHHWCMRKSCLKHHQGQQFHIELNCTPCSLAWFSASRRPNILFVASLFCGEDASCQCFWHLDDSQQDAPHGIGSSGQYFGDYTEVLKWLLLLMPINFSFLYPWSVGRSSYMKLPWRQREWLTARFQI